MNIAPVHTIFCQVMTSIITNRDVLTNGDGVEILGLQQHVVAVHADGMTLVVRGLVGTHDTFVACVGV